MKKPRTWNLNVYQAVADTALTLLGPINTWTKRVELPKKDGSLSMGPHPVGPDDMDAEDIQTAWRLILEVASAAARRDKLEPPQSEQACVMPTVICYFAPRQNQNLGTELLVSTALPFAHIAVKSGLLTEEEFYTLTNFVADCVSAKDIQPANNTDTRVVDSIGTYNHLRFVSDIVTSKAIAFDRNGLPLSLRGESPYYGVSVYQTEGWPLSARAAKEGQYLAAVRIPTGYKTIKGNRNTSIHLGFFKDPRDASYASLMFLSNIEENMKSYIEVGQLNWRPSIPTPVWAYPAFTWDDLPN